MWNDDPFEAELRLHFSLLDVPEPGAGALNTALRRFSRWRLRRRLLFVSPGFVAAASLGVGLSVSTAGSGHGGDRAMESSTLHHGSGDTIHLANYTFHLPAGFHPSAGAHACGVVVHFKLGSTPTPPPMTGTQRISTAVIATAATADGGCVEMYLTGPFAPTDPRIVLPFASSAHRVEIDGDVGWLTRDRTTHEHGRPTAQLTVEVAQPDGQVRDLAVGALGLSPREVLAVVARGLSTSQ